LCLENILVEIAFVGLKEAGIKYLEPPTQENKGTDKTKYCQFDKCHMHNIDDCIHLIDAIEILIQRGRLKQFTRNGSPEIKTVDQIVDGNNQDVIVAMFVEQR